jgi:CBS domain containing-hemolysin-like protein
MYIELIIVLFSILMSAFFSGIETGFISINKVKIFYLKEKNNINAIILSKLFEKPEKILSMILIGNNISNVVAATFFTILIKRFDIFNLNPELLVSIILTPFLLFFAEILPKTLFRENADKWVISLAKIIRFFYYILYIFILFFSKISELFLKLIGAKRRKKGLEISKDEFEIMVDNGNIDVDERKMIKSVFDLYDLQVKEIMVPRIKINAIEDSINYKKLIEFSMDCQNTRIPVYNESVDNIIGIINVNDLINNNINEDNFSLSKILRKPFYIPETKNVNELFKEMRKTKNHIAIIIDEYGGTAGLVTLEDIVEEIFGEIYDEFDQNSDFRYKILEDKSILVSSLVSLNDIYDEFGIDLECDIEDIDSIGGYLVNQFGRIPKIKEKIEIKNFLFEIVDSTRKNIKTIRIIKNKKKIE